MATIVLVTEEEAAKHVGPSPFLQRDYSQWGFREEVRKILVKGQIVNILGIVGKETKIKNIM